MPETHYINTPLKECDLNNLKIGDKVYISGIVYTARDVAHKRLIEKLDRNENLPFDLKNQIIYYVGPAPAPPGKPIGSAGPTTSYRMDPYSPILLDNGLKGMIGKGPRDKNVISSIKKNKAVYFAAIGGAAVLIAQSVKKSTVIAYEELGPEAVRELVVENFPCIVAIDINGNDIYDRN